MTVNVEILLARLEGVRRYGEGWRAKCPACGGKTRDKVSIGLGQDGRILVHCFAGCDAAAVISAAGLQLADLFPERLAPDTPEDRRRNRLLARQVGWGAALGVLEFEARIVLIVASDVAAGKIPSDDDMLRLQLAQARIEEARDALTDRPRFKPQAVPA